MFLGDAGDSPGALQVQCLMAEYKLILVRQQYSFSVGLDPLLFAIGEEIGRKSIEVNFYVLLVWLGRGFGHFVHEDELKGVVGLEHHRRASDEILLRLGVNLLDG